MKILKGHHLFGYPLSASFANRAGWLRLNN